MLSHLTRRQFPVAINCRSHYFRNRLMKSFNQSAAAPLTTISKASANGNNGMTGGQGGKGGKEKVWHMFHLCNLQSTCQCLDAAGESRATWQQLYLITWKSKRVVPLLAPPNRPCPCRWEHMGVVRVSFTSPKNAVHESRNTRGICALIISAPAPRFPCLQYTYSFNITTQSCAMCYSWCASTAGDVLAVAKRHGRRG